MPYGIRTSSTFGSGRRRRRRTRNAGNYYSIGQYVSFPVYQGDGQWDFTSGICKVQSGPTGKYFVNLLAEADRTHGADFYGPILLYIPADTISDDEAWELATTLSYTNDCAIAIICGMDGQVLHEGAFNVKLGAPASSSDKCVAGTIWADTKFVYACTATNTIQRSVLSSF